jgi:hypothetical protein
MGKRWNLLRAATILKDILLAYRECAFDRDIIGIEFKDGVPRLQPNPQTHPDRGHHGPFPDYLTSNTEFKEAALVNDQISLAMAPLGPLIRHLLAGKHAKEPLSKYRKPRTSARVIFASQSPSSEPS